MNEQHKSVWTLHHGLQSSYHGFRLFCRVNIVQPCVKVPDRSADVFVKIWSRLTDTTAEPKTPNSLHLYDLCATHPELFWVVETGLSEGQHGTYSFCLSSKFFQVCEDLGISPPHFWLASQGEGSWCDEIALFCRCYWWVLSKIRLVKAHCRVDAEHDRCKSPEQHSISKPVELAKEFSGMNKNLRFCWSAKAVKSISNRYSWIYHAAQSKAKFCFCIGAISYGPQLVHGKCYWLDMLPVCGVF